MRWLWSLGSVVIAAFAVGWFANPAAGWFVGVFALVAVLFAWRAGVAGNTSRSWARDLYGSGEQDKSDYASIMGHQLGRHSRRGKP